MYQHNDHQLIQHKIRGDSVILRGISKPIA
jgi:hypothetical protein